MTLSFLSLNTYAGFETPEDQKNKRLAERAVETKNYINSMVGKTAWYNSAGCATKPIYANKEQMSYRDAVYTTDNKYVPVTFLEADIYQDTDILAAADRDADEILGSDPKLEKAENIRLSDEVNKTRENSMDMRSI